MLAILHRERVDRIVHLAAETHVDRSIDDPGIFVETNIVGTLRLLDAALSYWRELGSARQGDFRFHHVSTDEVFGDLPVEGEPFTEQSPYAPRSPYAASKASADHLVRAWHETYGLPVLLSRSSNNYGPYQYTDKLIPLMIVSALEGRALPIYGGGENIRDWLHVEDHVRALERILLHGQVGQSYNIGGRAELMNLTVVEAICDAADAIRPRGESSSRREFITFVADRPGHDRRYAVDSGKIERELGWRAKIGFQEGLKQTVRWYVENEWWWRPIREKGYGGARLGLAG